MSFRGGNKLSNKFISSQYIDCVQAIPKFPSISYLFVCCGVTTARGWFGVCMMISFFSCSAVHKKGCLKEI